MMYTVIYVDENKERRWIKATDVEVAEEFGKQNSDGDYDLCVSLYEYDKLKNKIAKMEQILRQIGTLAKTNK